MGYHRGELAAQERAGVLEEAAHVAPIVSDEIPAAARGFLTQQPMLVVSAVDGRGAVWVTLLTGEPGFVRATGPSTLLVASTPAVGDPLHDVLAGPAQVGLLAIDPRTRRRVRMNGTARPTPEGLVVEIAEAYPNCPKYIQQRSPLPRPGRPGRAGGHQRAERGRARARRGDRHLLRRDDRPRRERRRVPPRRRPRVPPGAHPDAAALARLRRQLHVQHPGQPAGGPARRPAGS